MKNLNKVDFSNFSANDAHNSWILSIFKSTVFSRMFRRAAPVASLGGFRELLPYPTYYIFLFVQWP